MQRLISFCHEIKRMAHSCIKDTLSFLHIKIVGYRIMLELR